MQLARQLQASAGLHEQKVLYLGARPRGGIARACCCRATCYAADVKQDEHDHEPAGSEHHPSFLAHMPCNHALPIAKRKMPLSKRKSSWQKWRRNSWLRTELDQATQDQDQQTEEMLEAAAGTAPKVPDPRKTTKNKKKHRECVVSAASMVREKPERGRHGGGRRCLTGRLQQPLRGGSCAVHSVRPRQRTLGGAGESEISHICVGVQQQQLLMTAAAGHGGQLARRCASMCRDGRGSGCHGLRARSWGWCWLSHFASAVHRQPRGG